VEAAFGDLRFQTNTRNFGGPTFFGVRPFDPESKKDLCARHRSRPPRLQVFRPTRAFFQTRVSGFETKLVRIDRWASRLFGLNQAWGPFKPDRHIAIVQIVETGLFRPGWSPQKATWLLFLKAPRSPASTGTQGDFHCGSGPGAGRTCRSRAHDSPNQFQSTPSFLSNKTAITQKKAQQSFSIEKFIHAGTVTFWPSIG